MAASLRLRIALIACAALGVAAAPPALGQTMSSNSASYNAGWGRVAGQENQGANPQMRDANGNLLVIDGIIMNSSNSGLFSGGASSSGSGAFAGGATAIGNSLSVVTQGDNNVVIIDSRQINNGVVTATSTTSGGGNGD